MCNSVMIHVPTSSFAEHGPLRVEGSPVHIASSHTLMHSSASSFLHSSQSWDTFLHCSPSAMHCINSHCAISTSKLQHSAILLKLQHFSLVARQPVQVAFSILEQLLLQQSGAGAQQEGRLRQQALASSGTASGAALASSGTASGAALHPTRNAAHHNSNAAHTAHKPFNTSFFWCFNVSLHQQHCWWASSESIPAAVPC
jgi:hypothetical protein